jgi:MFS transporter, DHA2 family, multidrug resistance protein
MAENYKWLVTLVVVTGLFMPVIDTNIINVGLPHIMAAFGVGVDQIKWVITAYGMTFAIFTMLSTWLRSVVGAKNLYLSATIFFTVASMLCGLAWNNDVMILFRILQAMGGGVMLPIGMTMLTEAFPPHERGKAFGIFGIVLIFAPTLGPTLGGYLVDNVGWRYIFYINLPVGLLTMVLTVLLIKDVRDGRRIPLDLAGFLAISISLVFLLLALSEGQREGWTSNYILGSFLICGIGLAVFILTDSLVSHPLIDLSLFRSATFSLISALSLIRSIGLFGRIFLLPLFMQRVMGYTAMDAGWLIAPGVAVAGVGMPVVGRLSDRLGPKYFILAGFLLLSASQFLYYNLTADTPYWGLLWPHMVFGVGMACVQAPLMSTAMNVARRDQIGMVSSLQSVLLQVGGALGVAFLGTMLERIQVIYTSLYSEFLGSSTAHERLLRGLHFLVGRQGTDPATAREQADSVVGQIVARQSMVSAFDEVFIIAGLICLVGIPLVLFLKNKTAARGPS